MVESHNAPGTRRPNKPLRLLIGLALVGVVLFQVWQNGLDRKGADRPVARNEAESRSYDRESDRATSPQAPPQNASDESSQVPRKVTRVLAHVEQAGQPLEEYEGGRKFLNLGRDGEQKLPQTDARGKRIDYREWDVNPHLAGKNRGAERLITGTDGSAYYTADHYRTYSKIH